MNKLPSLSIVTQTYNEAELIEATVQQLFEVGQSVADDLEVVIVTSEASSDGTNDILADWSARDARLRTVIQPRDISDRRRRPVRLWRFTARG